MEGRDRDLPIPNFGEICSDETRGESFLLQRQTDTSNEYSPFQSTGQQSDCMFQDNQRSSIKTLSTSVSAMQEQEEIDRGHLSVLQAQVLNFTAKATQVSMSPFSTLFLLLLREPLALLLLLLLRLLK